MSRLSDALDRVSEAADDGTLPEVPVRRLVAIDPGKRGVIMAERGDDRKFWRADLAAETWQPAAKADPDPRRFMAQWDIVVDWLGGQPRIVVLEQPAYHLPGRQRMNAGTAARLGMESMAWRMMFAALRVPYVVAAPKKWQKAIGVPGRRGVDVKAEVQAIVGRRLPDVEVIPPKARKPHDGIADAAGMLLYARTLA